MDLQWEPGGQFLFTVSADQTTRIHAPWVRDDHQEVNEQLCSSHVQGNLHMLSEPVLQWGVSGLTYSAVKQALARRNMIWKDKVLLYCKKAYMGQRGIAPLILNLITAWQWVLNLMPGLLYTQGKNPEYAASRRWGGPQSCCGCSGGEKCLVPIPGIRPWIMQEISIGLVIWTRLLSFCTVM